MADKPISGATTITNLLGNEKLPVVKSGSAGDYNTTTQDILNIGSILPAHAAGGSGLGGVNVTVRASYGDGAGGGGFLSAFGGDGGATGDGGYAFLAAGSGGATSGNGANLFLYAGGAQGTGNAGDLTLSTSPVGTQGNGGNFAIVLIPGAGTGTNGVVTVNNDPSLFSVSKSWYAGEVLNGRTIYTASRKEKITAIIGRVDTANGGAATLVVVKCPSGTAPGGGTALTSNSMDLAGTPATNQTLSLSATAANLLLAAGDSLCLVESGALGTSVGCITVHSTPQ